MERGRTIGHTRDFDQFAQLVRSHFDRSRAELSITAAAEDGANTRAFTVRVVDRLKGRWAGRWRFCIFLAAAAGGDPDATGNTFTLTSGTVLQTVTAHALYHVLTDDQGEATFTLALGAGPASRYVYADIDGQLKEFGPFTWT